MGTKTLILIACLALVGYMVHKRDCKLQELKQIQSTKVEKKGIYIHASSDYNELRWNKRRMNDEAY